MRKMEFTEYYKFLTEPLEIFSGRTRVEMLKSIDERLNYSVNNHGVEIEPCDLHKIKICILYELEHAKDLMDPGDHPEIVNIGDVIYSTTFDHSNMRVIMLSTGRSVGIRCYFCQPARKVDIVIFTILKPKRIEPEF